MNMQKDEQNFAVFSVRQFGHWSGNNSLIDVATRVPPHTKWQSSRLELRGRVLGFTWWDDVGPASGSGLLRTFAVKNSTICHASTSHTYASSVFLLASRTEKCSRSLYLHIFSRTWPVHHFQWPKTQQPTDGFSMKRGCSIPRATQQSIGP